MRRLRAARVWKANGFHGAVLRVPSDWAGQERVFVNYHRDISTRVGGARADGVAVYAGTALPEKGSGRAPVPVAVKEIEVAQGFASPLDLAREAAGYIETAQRLGHSRQICLPLGLGLLQSDGPGVPDRLVIAMPYLPLSAARALVLAGPGLSLLPMESVWGWATGLASAVHELHSAGILHRNIKPENVFVDADGVVVLSDLGHAELAASCARDQSGSGVPGFTGYRAYLAPEVRRALGGVRLAARGALASAWASDGSADLCSFASDVWSLGAVLFEIATRRQLFAVDTAGTLDSEEAGGAVACVQAFVQRELPVDGLSHEAADRRRFLEFLAATCLSPVPQKRATVAAVLARLRDPDTVGGAVIPVRSATSRKRPRSG